MNCKKHPQDKAVSLCTNCGSGLCVSCAKTHKKLCASCVKGKKRDKKDKALYSSIASLIIYTTLFILGYRWNFAATENYPDSHFGSGYILMSLFTGYQLVKFIFPTRMTKGTATQWNLYYLFKFILYAVVGFFTAPITVIWNIVKLIIALVKR